MPRLRGRQLQTRRAMHRDRNPWCVECLKRGDYVPWVELDHVIALTNGGTDTDDNLQGLCAPHHATKTRKDLWQRLSGCGEDGTPIDPSHHWNSSAVATNIPVGDDLYRPWMSPPDCPVFVVCGAPGCGKSTYVENYKQPDDLMVDLDVIKSEMTGAPIHLGPNNPRAMRKAMARRNEILRDLDGNSAVWMVIGAPLNRDREHWRRVLNAKTIVLEVPIEIIKERIYSDLTRGARQHLMFKWAKDWWRRYEPTPSLDVIVKGQVT